MSEANPYAPPAAHPPPVEQPVDFPALVPPQSIAFRPHLEDQMAWWDYCYANEPHFRKSLSAGAWKVVAAGIAFAATGALIQFSDEPAADWAGIGGVGLGLLLILGGVLRGPSRKMYSRRGHEETWRRYLGGDEGPSVTVRLLANCLRYDDQQGSIERYWRCVRHVEANELQLVFVLEADSMVSIPSRCFPDRAEYAGWCDLATRLWREAHEAGDETT